MYKYEGEASNSDPSPLITQPDSPVKVLVAHSTTVILPSQNHTQSSWTMLSHQNSNNYEEPNYFRSVSITDRTSNGL